MTSVLLRQIVSGAVAIPRRSVGICIGIVVVSMLMLLAGLDQPGEPYFDETHYVPAVVQLLHPNAGALLNSEHPPLAKEIMAAGVAIFGDSPFGWRFMSALFGSLSLLGIYVWARVLFANDEAALWATGLTMVNQLLYVQARIAMLDIFAVAFMVWALAAASATWRYPTRAKTLWVLAGVLFGLSTACKWIGVLPWAMCIAIVGAIKVLQHWQMRSPAQSAEDWYRHDLWSLMRWRNWFLCLGVVPVLAYGAAFVPVYGLSLGRILAAQEEMWRLQSSIGTAHPYASGWMSWPVLARPIWYLFKKKSDDTFAAVVALGNPLVLWSGVAAVLYCAVDWVRTKHWQPFVILLTYAALYLTWAVIPRGITFHYYYLPATMVLSLALTSVFYRTRLVKLAVLRWGFLLCAGVVFILFLPITCAAVGTTLAGYNQLMWFASWR